jgi:hypothetical protein
MSNASSPNPGVPAALAAALPRRPIVVRPPASSPLGYLGLLALLFSMLAGILAWLGPDLTRDWNTRDATAATDRARIEETRCHTGLVVLSFCHIAVTDGADGAEAKRMLRYAFIGTAPEQPVQLQRSRSDPSLLTTDLGLERVLSRLITLVLLCAIPLVAIRVTVMTHENAGKAQQAFAAMSGQRLTPVIVEIERKNLIPPRRRLWAYLYEGDRGRERALIEWPARDRPLFTSEQEKWAVALKGEQDGPPLLLDAGLTCLDVTDAERAAFHEACRAAFARPQTADSV